MTAPVKPPQDAAPEDQPLEGSAFNPDAYDWERHLKVALRELPVKKLLLDVEWRYYDGDHPRVWMTEAIKNKLDDDLITNMAENWCDLAVDNHVKRMSIDGFTSKEDQSVHVKAADNVFDENDLWNGQKTIYTAARCVGESFAFVWEDDNKEFGVDITVNDARNVWWPDDAHRSDPSRVVKVWADEEAGIWRATCYYKYVVVRLVGPKVKMDVGAVMPTSTRGFKPDPDDPGGEHGFEQVPVIRFARDQRRISIVRRIMTLQDKINKLSANMMVSAEFAAFRKTIIMTQQAIEDDDLHVRPNRILVLDPGATEGVAPTSVWEGQPTDLEIYDKAIDRLIDKLFTKASLPGHMKIATGREVPSGAAYEADEGPFTEDVIDQTNAFGNSWSDLFELLGIEVQPAWRNPHIKSDVDEGNTVKVFKEAGVPVALALKYYAGWDADMLKELEEAPLTPQEQQAMAVAGALAGDPEGEAQPDDPTKQPQARATDGPPQARSSGKRR